MESPTNNKVIETLKRDMKLMVLAKGPVSEDVKKELHKKWAALLPTVGTACIG